MGRDDSVTNNTIDHSILQVAIQEMMASLSTSVSMAVKQKWDTIFHELYIF